MAVGGRGFLYCAVRVHFARGEARRLFAFLPPRAQARHLLGPRRRQSL